MIDKIINLTISKNTLTPTMSSFNDLLIVDEFNKPERIYTFNSVSSAS